MKKKIGSLRLHLATDIDIFIDSTQIANGKACIIVVGISCFDYGLHKSLDTKV